MDFRELFNVSNLTDEELGHLEFVLGSPSYERVFEPYLKTMKRTLIRNLCDPSQEREQKYPSDYCRGGIHMIDGLLTLFRKLVAETQMERVARAQGTPMGQEDIYQKLREEGHIRGGGQIDDPPDYDPREDF